MRETIFKSLYQQKGVFVSGEQLSEKLDISRAAVSKHITALKKDGAIIESVQHKGHRLQTAPDRMKEPYVMALLQNKARIATFAWYDTIGSTNEILKQNGDKLDEISICTCEHQPDGKGRRGRAWSSSKHRGVFVSFLLKPPILTSDAFKITTIAAIAQVRTIKAQLELNAQIKWPNDVLIDGKKLSGTLTDLSADFDGVNYIVCGVGINVNHTPDDFTGEVSKIATSLRITNGAPIDRLQFFAAFIDEFIACYDAFCMRGLAPLMAEYTRYSVYMGKQVRLIGAQSTQIGEVLGFDENGALLLNTEEGTKTIVAGELSLRGVDGYV